MNFCLLSFERVFAVLSLYFIRAIFVLIIFGFLYFVSMALVTTTIRLRFESRSIPIRLHFDRANDHFLLRPTCSGLLHCGLNK